MIAALRALHDRKATAALITALQDTDPTVQRNAAEALGALEDPAATTALLAALHNRRSFNHQEAVRALGWIHDPRAIPALIAVLRAPDNDMCWCAAAALGKYRKAAAPQLLAVLRDAHASPLAHAAAAGALGLSHDPRVVPSLAQALADNNTRVRQLAATALAHTGDARASQALIKAMGDSNISVRWLAPPPSITCMIRTPCPRSSACWP